jgi:restriction system protein
MARGRGKARRRDSESALLLIIGVLVAAAIVVQTVQEHPVAASLAAVAVVGVTVAGGWLWIRRSRRLALRERTLAVADVMSGSEFEHWVARLMRASGCRRVRVSGGAGDMGADVTGYSPDGRRLVVQCKRYSTKVGSPEVQRFAGTAHHIHSADVALLVTTNYLTAQGADVARRCHISVVDRDVLGSWAASLTLPIPEAPGRPATALIPRFLAARRRQGHRGGETPAKTVRATLTDPAPVSTAAANTIPPPGAAPNGTDWWNETS